MPSEILVALIESREDRVSIGKGAGATHTHYCSRARDLVDMLSDVRVVAVVLELSATSAREAKMIIDAMNRHARLIPLLLRFELRVNTMRAHYAHLTEDPHVRFSVRGADELHKCVAMLLEAHEIGSARLPMAAALLPVVREEVRNIVLAAVTIGERKTTVPEFARVCGLPTRTLDAHCHDADLPSPNKLLTKMLVAHSHYRVTVVGMTSKGAAAAARLSADRLSRRTERAFGHTFAQLCERYPFDALLRGLADQLRA